MKSSLQLSVFFALICVSITLDRDSLDSENSADFIECPNNLELIEDEEDPNKLFCECKDTFLYHPEDDSCYDAFRQGPCPSEHYFILPPGEPVAKCEKNPCVIDGLVPFQGKCHILWERGNPCNDKKTPLGINNNFQIECGSSRYLGSWRKLRISKSCPENSYLVSTNDDHTNYICECKNTFIFSPKNNSCQLAYRQGPCPSGNYIVLPLGEAEPRCEKNPCHEDGLVPFKGGCYHVHKNGHPCSNNTRLSITKDTSQLECVDITVTPYDGHYKGGGIINAPLKACPAGSRRVFTTCKHVLQ